MSDTMMQAESIETARLFLRTATADDAEELLAFLYRNRDFLAPWEPDRDEGYFSMARQTQNLIRMEGEQAAGVARHFLIFHREDRGMVIGTVSFSGIMRGPFQSCFTGYRVDRACAGKGFMAEALRAACEHMFLSQGLHRVEANIIPRNIASVKTAERAGFVREGYSPAYLSINGRWEDHLRYTRRNRSME